jgi:hypothetical protein
MAPHLELMKWEAASNSTGNDCIGSFVIDLMTVCARS